MSASFFKAALKIWRHKTRGTFYQVHDEGCRVQCETPLQDGEMVYLYRDVHSGGWSVRRGAEFNDGRFENLGRANNFGDANPDEIIRSIQVFRSNEGKYPIYEGPERRICNVTVRMNRRRGILSRMRTTDDGRDPRA